MRTGCAVLVAVLAVVLLALTTSSISTASDDDCETDAYTSDILNRVSSARSGDTVKILTSGTLTSDLTIPKGVTVLVPFSASDENGVADGGSDASAFVDTSDPYVTLTVAKGVTVYVNGTLTVGSVVGKEYTWDYQCHTSGAHSQITLNGSIVVNADGSLRAYGFIKGPGTVTALAGGAVYEPVTIADFVGGDNMLNLLKSGQMPFYRYSFLNIQSEMTICSSAEFHATARLYANKAMNYSEIKIVGTDNSLMTLADGASATFTYDPDRNIRGDSKHNINSDIGTTTVTLKGGASFNAASISLTVFGQTVTESFSQVAYGFSYTWQCVMTDGWYYMNESFRFMPGSTLTVEEDAVLVVNKELQVFDGLEDITWREKRYPTSDELSRNGFCTCASLFVDGYMIVNSDATFLGTVQSHGTGRVLVDEGAHVESTEVKCGCIYSYTVFFIEMEETRNRTSRTMSGQLADDAGNVLQMQAGCSYVCTSGSTYQRDGYTQTNDVDGVTTTYQVTRTLQGFWKEEEVTPPEPEDRHPVDFLVTVSSDTVSMSDVQNAYIKMKCYEFNDFEYPRLVIRYSTESITVSSNCLSTISKIGADLLLKNDTASVQFSSDMLKQISKDLKLHVELGNSVLNSAQKNTCKGLTTMCMFLYEGDAAVSTTGYKVTVSLNYSCSASENPDALRIWYVDGNGEAYDYSTDYTNGVVTFSTVHFSNTEGNNAAYAVSFKDASKKGVDDLDFSWIIIAVIVIVVMIAAIAAAIWHMYHGHY